MRTHLSICIASTALLSALGLGCSGAAGPGSSSDPDEGVESTSTTDVASADAGAATATATADAGTLTGDQIVGVLYAANAGDVALANLALDTSSTPAVVSYATAIKTSATFNSSSGLAMLQQTDGLTPQTSNVQAQLGASTQSSIASLQGETGSQFDADFAEAQVTSHQQLLQLVQNTLAPQAQDPALQSFVQGYGSMVQSHLQMAQELAGNLEEAGAPRVEVTQR